ncbi:MAG: MATE family efflux transporter [Phycisphaeraceae bacterium]|nr:MATE family efflux transporter [Phycisphaeraceae bacterium]
MATMERPPRDGGDFGTNPVREMLKIALPSVLTMTSYTVMQFIDALMVSRIQPADPVYVAAQGNGGIAIWLVVATVMGMLTVINTYVAQHLGAGRPERGSAYAWAAIWMSLVFALLIIPYAGVLPAVFRAQDHAGALLELETEYARIMALGAFMLTASRGLQHYFYGMHRPQIVMVAAFAGNVCNVFVNWVLIFGNLGAPELGLAGAAWGTVAGVTVELLIPMVMFLGPGMHRAYQTRHFWRPSWRPVKDIVRLGWPGAAMFANEMICWTYLMTFLGPAGGRAAAAARGLGPEDIARAGEIANSAGWAALRYMHMSFMPAVGVSIAVTALVGRSMGMKRPDLAAARARLGLKIAMWYMGLCAVIFLVFRAELIAVFAPGNMDEPTRNQLIAVGAKIMIAAAVFQLFDAIAITISGALRGAGDTIWPGVATVVLSWVCIVGGGHLMIALFPGLGEMGPWIAASAYIMLLGVALLWRYARGPWRGIDLVGRSEVAAGEAADAEGPGAETRTSAALSEVPGG